MKQKSKLWMISIVLLSLSGCACQKMHVSDLPPIPKPIAPESVMKPNQSDFLNELKAVFSPSPGAPTK